MRVVNWNQCTGDQRSKILSRAAQVHKEDLRQQVSDIIQRVQSQGDAAIRELTRRFDHIDLDCFQVSDGEFKRARAALPDTIVRAITTAYRQISVFHQAGLPKPVTVETCPGVTCFERFVGLQRVGLYVPGGATPLPSTALMIGVPAQLAECGEALMCTAPRKDGTADPAVLFAAQLCGIKSVYKVGGAQAIAAMALGTESISACNKIFGPGSIWVTEAKRQVAAGEKPVAIDMPAGPSEVLVVADSTANADFVASDLIAQAEHGCDSQALLVTTCDQLARQVSEVLDQMKATLPRRDLIQASLDHSTIIVVDDLKQAIRVSNEYAPEHLIIQAEKPEELLNDVTAAGSVFLGSWTPEVLGDYCSGTNHVLPTGGYAKAYNGLSVCDFQKRMTVQTASPDGFTKLSETAEALARWEGLEAHRQAISIRRKALELVP